MVGRIIRFCKQASKTFSRLIETKKTGKIVSKLGKGVKINSPCKFTKFTYIDDYCNFNGIKIYGKGTVRFGRYFHSGDGCKIITNFHNYDSGYAIPYDDTYIQKNVTIEDFVWIGTDVLILGGVTIGEGCIIQAGSVVVKDIPPLAIAGGNPAEVFKYRDKEHFKILKAEGKFH